MQKKNPIVPPVMWIAVFFTITLNCLTYYGARALTEGRFHYDLTNRAEEQIPFLPWTVLIYGGCYLFWIMNYAIGCRQEKEEAFCFMGADILAKLVCLFCFLLFPTTNVRPVIEGHSLWEELMRLLYRVDAADNLFPSIHCLTSWLCVIAVRRNKKIPRWYRVVSVLIALSVCVSTLTTKQHVIADVIAGVLLAEGSYFAARRSGFSEWYMNRVTSLYDKITGRRKRLVGITAEERAPGKDGESRTEAGSAAKKVKVCVIVGFVLIILLVLKEIFHQQIDSVESLQQYMKRFGLAAPVMLTLFQALQVVVPVLPGYLGCAAGAVAFGTMTGFWCNYIGISLGSVIAYFLAKKYGKSIVLSMFPQKQYEKWSERVKQSKSYGWFLFVATLLPLFPDDFLCYFSGLMKMNSKKFIWIIILGKPWCILAYSIGFGLIG